MGKTLAEKIISGRAGRDVSAGDLAIVNVDFCFTHDASGPLLIQQLKEMGKSVADPSRTAIFIDHAVPAPRKEIANDHVLLREFAEETGIHFSDAGNGICHQVMAEDYANPGEIVVGTDSHTVMAGALGAFATGMGATDIAVAMSLRKTWLRIPETFRIQIDGRPRKGVYSKDIMLHLLGRLGADGANYKALEFDGSTITDMPMNERFVFSNMSIEAGAKVGLIPTDAVTKAYLEEMDRGDKFKAIAPDPDAKYEKIIQIEADRLQPCVAASHSPANVKTLDQIGEVKVDVVFIGSCTNSRIEDLRIAAKILKGRKTHPQTRLLVTPASRKILLEAVADGTMKTLLEAGAVTTPPGCGACFGALGGIPADGEVMFATTNRNFKGRTGNPNAFTYLGSPAMAAATAVKGVITDPAEFL